MARQYAEGTVVSVEKSRAEIETLLLKYGADQLMNAVDTASGEYVVGFRYRGMYAKLNLRVPLVTDPRFRKTKQGRPMTELQRKNAAEAEARRLWRALVLVVKAKLEAVASPNPRTPDEQKPEVGHGNTPLSAVRSAARFRCRPRWSVRLPNL